MELGAISLLVCCGVAWLAGSVWTWWLMRAVRVADEQRVQPIKDACVAEAQTTRALADIVTGLGRELTEAHHNHANIVSVLAQRQGGATASLSGGNMSQDTVELEELMREQQRLRNRRTAMSASRPELVDPSDVGEDEE